jgi:diacylglycerol O-acyltransferase
VPTALLVTLLRAQTRTIDFATSNLRGSPVDLYLGGARIEASYPMGPRAGVPANITMMTYCGNVHLGIHSDPAAVMDPDLLLAHLREAFAELASASR